MKTIFKSLFVAIVFVAAAGAAKAQGNSPLGAQATVNTSARILKQITLTPTNLNFGRIAAGGGATFLDPRGQASVNVGFTSTPGSLVINATAEEDVRVEFPDWVVMTLGGVAGADSISFLPQISVIHGNQAINATNRQNSVLMNNTAVVTPFPATNTGGTGRGPFGIVTTQGGGNDNVTLYIGGNLWEANGGANTQIPTSKPTGSYTGAMVFNVLYAN